jgi:hypothetical protein
VNDRFARRLEEFGARTTLVRGPGPERLPRAIHAIESLFA